MKKLLLILAVFFIASGFTKEDISSQVNKKVFENLKTEITKVKDEEDLWAIFDAVKSNDYAEVKTLLENGVKANIRDWANNTPLMVAAFRGYTSICELLLSYYTPDMSIDEINEYGWTALMFAAKANKAETVKFLIAKKADKHHKTISFSETVIGVAAANNAIKALDVLISQGVSVEEKNDFGYTPLMFAVEEGKAEAVLHLITKHKANIEARTIEGQTPLMRAAARNRYKVLQILIANYAKINAQDNYDRTPLMYAAEAGNYDCVAYLISDKRAEKAKINIKDVFDKTALKYAVENNNFKTAELLKQNGAKM